MNFVDSHCHLYYEPYVSNLNNIINKCQKKKINKLLTISVDSKTSKKNVEIAEKFNEIFCSIGIHPSHVLRSTQSDIEEIKNLFQLNNKIIAIGEIGLDLFRNKNLNQQIDFFESQICFAIEKDLPIIIHTREAEEETIAVLKKYISKNLKFLIHCFAGTQQFADKIIELGGYISFSGILTFKNSEKIRNVCKTIPLEKIMIETDSPYLSPEPLRGQVNCPSNVILVANKISQIKNIDVKDVGLITSQNFSNFFSI